MAHTYTNILIHGLFSTKDREAWLRADMRNEVFSYLGGTLNKLRGQSLLVNGVSDHVHKEQHKRVSFQEEVVAFLKKQGIAYEAKYLFN